VGSRNGAWRGVACNAGSRCQVPDRRCLRGLELHLSAMACGGPKRLPFKIEDDEQHETTPNFGVQI
jgi:hypothetical protein